MATQNQLLRRQLDQKLKRLGQIREFDQPSEGWLHSIRIALRMSLRQLGARMGISAQSVRDLEQREESGSASLNALRHAAKAMDMKLVYCFVPMEASLEKMVEKRAVEIATQVILRTSASMKLEDQATTDEYLREAIREKADEIKREMPRYLWD